MYFIIFLPLFFSLTLASYLNRKNIILFLVLLLLSLLLPDFRIFIIGTSFLLVSVALLLIRARLLRIALLLILSAALLLSSALAGVLVPVPTPAVPIY